MNFKSDYVRVTIDNRTVGIFTEPAYIYWLLNTSIGNKNIHKAMPLSYFKLKFSESYFDLLQNKLIKVNVDELECTDSIGFIN